MESQNGLGWGDLEDPSCSSPCPEQGQLPPDQLVQTLWPSLMYHQGIYDLWVFQLECCLEKTQKMLQFTGVGSECYILLHVCCLSLSFRGADVEG